MCLIEFMKPHFKTGRFFVLLLLIISCITYNFPIFVSAEENELASSKLHAKYAVLMDADSKRVLYGKNADTPAPMASTTKIMTCVIALEYGSEDLLCTTSSYAASMPDVQLNAKKGELFYLKDLLYSLMLKSHNDSAVIIAENVACNYIYQVRLGNQPDDAGILNGKNLDYVNFSTNFDTSFLNTLTSEQSKELVSVFTGLMNYKAALLGCENTHFVTPNGLDASDESGVHSTTAKELAMIMSYCIENETFLKITQTMQYSFSSYQNKASCELTPANSYSVSNANAFLNMYDNIISGKTGFTGDAGYCYTCAYRCDGRTFVVTLLACGWPSNKTYKWQDARLLLNWARENYYWQDILKDDFYLKDVSVSNGTSDTIHVSIHDTYQLLLSKNDTVNVVMNVPECIEAPVKTGDVIGSVCVYINDELMYSTPVSSDCTVIRTDYKYFLNKVIKFFCFIDK